jgi:hypothetical protein
MRGGEEREHKKGFYGSLLLMLFQTTQAERARYSHRHEIIILNFNKKKKRENEMG